MQIKEKIKRNFSKSAPHYDEYAHLQKEIAGRLIEQIKETEFCQILDIGCGTGYLALALAEKFPNASLSAIDLAPGMIEYASLKNPFANLQFSEGDGEKLEFSDQRFDLVVSSSAFQWMDPNLSFTEVKRVIKPGGKFYFSLFGPATLAELKSNEEEHRPNNLKAISLADLLRGIGFEDVAVASSIKRAIFPDFMSLLRLLKDLGAQSSSAPVGFGSRRILVERALSYTRKFMDKDGIYASFEVLFGKGRRA